MPNEVIDNGFFGAYTEKLVKNFKEKNGFHINGVIDENCWQEMKS